MFCVDVRNVVHAMKVCLPWSGECVEALSLRLRLALAWGLKSRGGRVDASLSSEGCFKLCCIHSADLRFTGSLIVDVTPFMHKLKNAHINLL